MAGLQGKKYSGDLYGRPFGSEDGFTKMGNVKELKTKRDMDSNDLLSTGREDYGEALSTDNKPGATEVEIVFDTFDKYGMARALMGTAIDLDTAPVDFADKELTVGLGWLKLGYEDIDPETFALKDSLDAPIAANQYELNPRLGMIHFTASATPLVGSKVKYSGKTLGSAGYQVDANTLASLPMEMYLDGQDRVTGADGMLIIPHAVMTANGDMNWMTDDWWEAGFNGKLIKEPGKPAMRFREHHAK